MKKTVLYQSHVSAGARMVEFGGWLMPVQYQGAIAEHKSVRENAGLFDVSHMGEVSITGPEARQFLNWLLTNDISKLSAGEIIYSLMLNEKGGAIDDLLVYCRGEEDFLLVVNASNREKDFAWISEKANGRNLKATDISDDYALLALQGPKSSEILGMLCDIPSNLKYYHFAESSIDGAAVIVSRTGYTGEDGYEIFVPPSDAGKIWDIFLSKGKDLGLEPCGLAVRDLLRIEAGYSLYGHEIDEDIDPVTAGLKWAIKKSDADYIGRSAIDGKKPDKKKIAFTMEDKGVPRQGYPLVSSNGERGEVVSGTFSPALQKGIGIGYISRAEGGFPKKGETIFVEIRGKRASAVVCGTPFIKSRVFKN